MNPGDPSEIKPTVVEQEKRLCDSSHIPASDPFEPSGGAVAWAIIAIIALLSVVVGFILGRITGS